MLSGAGSTGTLNSRQASCGVQLVGVGAALLLIDRLGRRPLLIGGSAACCLSMLAIAAADASADVVLLLAGMCSFIVAFRHALAPTVENVLARLHLVCSLSYIGFVIKKLVLLSTAARWSFARHLVWHSRKGVRLSDVTALSLLYVAQHVLGGSVLGAHVRDVQHERQVPGRVSGDGDAVPRR